MTVTTDTAVRQTGRSQAGHSPPFDRKVVVIALLLLGLGGFVTFEEAGGRMAALFAVGGALGVTLYHAAFGFTGSWRSFLKEGRGAGLRAQMVMLAVATAIFLPLLSLGSAFGQPLGGSVSPVGVSVLLGAFLFGVGMQLGGGCASGTLFTVGGGSTRMVITLIFFMVGSVLGSLHLPWWLDQPSLGRISLLSELGLWGALALQGGIFALIALATVVVERRRHGGLVQAQAAPVHGWRRILQGPWPLVIGGVALALLNVATLLLAGHGWNVSFGYTLWGAKLASAGGMDVASWSFWTWNYPSNALQGSIFAETTSVMNIAIILGALLAAGMAGKFAPTRRIPWKSVLAAVIGGILMGYGARLAFGCNIGAFFTGVASGSVHGWLWLVAAIAGNYIGVKVRPFFALDRSG